MEGRSTAKSPHQAKPTLVSSRDSFTTFSVVPHSIDAPDATQKINKRQQH